MIGVAVEREEEREEMSVSNSLQIDDGCRERHETLKIVCCVQLQWNLSNPDTLGTEESVLISEVP